MNIERDSLQKLGAPEILNSLADGAYITDTQRNIVFWNRAAERITGWPASEVVGRSCRDNILVHEDKDGHKLCGEEYCPLRRSIVTGQSSLEPVLVFANTRDGARVPVEVSVSPIVDKQGKIVGGIEVFRDMTAAVQEMLRARSIQEHSLACALPEDKRVVFDVRYIPNEIVGGDFYRIERVDEDRYALMIADVMGHGISAALYTMQLRSLWEDHREELLSPSYFLTRVNQRVHALVKEAGYFATAACASFNAATGELRYVCAGHPAPLIVRAVGQVERLNNRGPALGMFEHTVYADVGTTLHPGDAALLYTDGAVEITNVAGDELGVEGLQVLLQELAASFGRNLQLPVMEERLLRYSDQIRLADDLTLLKIQCTDDGAA